MTDSLLQREVWEEELLAGHRWGKRGDRADEEMSKLRKLWDAIHPVNESIREVTNQIVALEICNWKLEESLLALCRAIGERRPAEMRIGHDASVTEERWRQIWAYYFALRNWLPSWRVNGYQYLLREHDGDGELREHVAGLLGDRNAVKELYVMRLCLCLDYWLGGCYLREEDSPQKTAHAGAVAASDREIRQLEPEDTLLNVFLLEGDGKLNPCHHKLFRRLDVITSSIGAGRLFGAMPMRGTDGVERADLLETYLAPIEMWLKNGGETSTDKGLPGKIIASLGERDATGAFLATLLVSLLRPQQMAARERAARAGEYLAPDR